MKYDLGFVSAIFADKTFEQVIDFAAENDFQCVELMCWPKGKAERRYAGVTHIDVDDLSDEAVERILNYLDKKNVYISGLGYYPNPLDADEAKREVYINHILKIITAAKKLNIPVVNTFIGRNSNLNIDQNITLFKEVWAPILAHAKSNQIKIGIENCPMYFTNDEWPDGKNIAINSAVWDQLFAVENGDILGLNYDPSHLLWMQMDYLSPLKDYAHKLFHLHLKDAHVDQLALKKLGILATPLQFHSPKLPGLGDIDWAKYFDTLRQTSYSGPVVIEFEDKLFESSAHDIVKGLLQTRDYLQSLNF